MKNIIFIAPPAAGKGTISSMICSKYNIPHISTGDLLRNEIANLTKIGREIKDTITRGEFVSDELITKLLKKRLSSKDCQKGYILDGYPRNIKQAEIYDSILKELSYEEGKVIFLDIDKETAVNRITSRLVCPKCKQTYNASSEELSPVNEGICDSCSSNLIKREDDTLETYEERYNTYLKETFPLVEYYQNKNNLVRIDVRDKSTYEIFEEVKKVIK